MSTFSPVEQTSLYDGRGGRGNCVAACVASIFGLTLEETGLAPGVGFQEVANWTRERVPALEYREQGFCTNYRLAEGDGRGGPGDRWEYDPPQVPAGVLPGGWALPTCGLWVAHVVSPRGLLRHGPYRGTPIQHAVVMRGGALLWDPHPQREQGVGQALGMGWWVAREPGLLLGR